MHFRKVINKFNEDKELHEILNEVYPFYKKSNIGFENLYPLTETAIMHSEQVLQETRCKENLIDHNPYTHVHLVVRHLQKIARRPFNLR